MSSSHETFVYRKKKKIAGLGGGDIVESVLIALVIWPLATVGRLLESFGLSHHHSTSKQSAPKNADKAWVCI